MDYSLDPLSYAMSLSFPFPGPPATTQAPDPNPPLGIPDLSELDLESLLFPDNPFPSSPTIEILSASSSKNKPRLLVDGHLYNFKRQYKNGRLLHRCSQRTPPCLATITTDKEKVCILTTAGEHNHPKPSSEKLRRLSTRSRVASSAETSTQPFYVFAKESGLEKTDALKQLHYRYRKNSHSSFKSPNE